MTEFQKELTELINKHSVENDVDMPDFMLAELLVNQIRVIGYAMKANLDWHGCDSICHPKPNSPSRGGGTNHL